MGGSEQWSTIYALAQEVDFDQEQGGGGGGAGKKLRAWKNFRTPCPLQGLVAKKKNRRTKIVRNFFLLDNKLYIFDGGCTKLVNVLFAQCM